MNEKGFSILDANGEGIATIWLSRVELSPCPDYPKRTALFIQEDGRPEGRVIGFAWYGVQERKG